MRFRESRGPWGTLRARATGGPEGSWRTWTPNPRAPPLPDFTELCYGDSGAPTHMACDGKGLRARDSDPNHFPRKLPFPFQQWSKNLLLLVPSNNRDEFGEGASTTHGNEKNRRQKDGVRQILPVRRRDGGEAGINYKCYKTTTRWYFSGYDFPPKNN